MKKLYEIREIETYGEAVDRFADKRTPRIRLEKKSSVLNASVFLVGAAIMLLQWILGLNIMTLIGALYMCFVSAMTACWVFFKKQLKLWFLIGYAAVGFGIATFYIFNGADAGWGAFTSGHTGFFSADYPLWQGSGNFGTRLAGNILFIAPAFLLITAIYCSVVFWRNGSTKVKNVATSVLCVLLMGMSIVFVFIMNLRSNPKVFDLSKGHDEYLNNVKKNVSSDNPNVLVIMMDDLGYGDTSYNARKTGRTPSFETPNIDWIAESGLDFDNFYSSYSVCSPARFAFMTGRYPYRGYADNVIYPTVNTLSPFSSTRYFNSFEMGANVDGLLGDEVTIAETFQAAGYSTGLFGKWHLGDYGQYLPTNQGFDYFYGAHSVNDMVPFYHVTEERGEYTIDYGTNDMDQSEATKRIHEKTSSWITEKAENNEKFFAFYATPWPHAPVYAGYDFQGSTGAGIYGDCVTEFDHYLGELFETMENLGVLDDTIIMFTSDNGPALQGSASELRGGKYSPYEAGQKVPFYMRWGNNPLCSNSAEDQKARTVSAPAMLADIYPTLAEMCNITNLDESVSGYLPNSVDREIDGVSMLPAIRDTTNSVFLHGAKNPILHMKREKIQAVQYSLSREDVLKSVEGYSKSGNHSVQTGNAAGYADLPFIRDNEYTTWKYFKRYKNDNPEFFNLNRKNWLICLTDDVGESYQRADAFPTLATQYQNTLDAWTKRFQNNRRGYYETFYKK